MEPCLSHCGRFSDCQVSPGFRGTQTIYVALYMKVHSLLHTQCSLGHVTGRRCLQHAGLRNMGHTRDLEARSCELTVEGDTFFSGLSTVADQARPLDTLLSPVYCAET